MTGRLLVAEDDVIIRVMISDFLRDAGFDVTEAGNADEAVAILESNSPFDVVFSDIKMPGSMDGQDLARRVEHRWPDTEVILTSGYSSELSGLAGLAKNRVLAKPYRPLSVLAAILAVVDP
ncbi:MAG TPA: response regulator [Alphaproteobacteria bacterium]|jgi:CheY-like chemotaxis protein|nr:response regulator [Alphaproteobacteria bacterium]